MDITEKDFVDIVRQNKDRLKHLSRIYADRIDEEKDIYQEILVQAWRSLPNFNGSASLGTWIYRLAVNTAISFVRKKKTRRSYYSKFKDEQEPDSNLKYSNETDEQVVTLYDSISKLPQRKPLSRCIWKILVILKLGI